MGLLPPLVGVAVKSTKSPAQIGVFGLAVIVIEGVTAGLTVTVMVLLVPVVGLAQDELEVMVTEIASPSFKVVEEKVAPVCPVLVPLSSQS